MALKKKGKYSYGDCQADIPEEMNNYSQFTGYPIAHFADAVCLCGERTFQILLDDESGVAMRTCRACGIQHAIGDSAEYLDDATLEECECPCGGTVFEATAGVSLYEGSDDVKWFYLGLRCAQCGLTACYGDWKNEYMGYQELLQKV